MDWLAALKSRLQRAFPSGHVSCVADADAPVAVETQPAGSPFILVVDDEPDSLADVCELLAAWRISPTSAANGAQAVTLARTHDFDLILMDLQMPVLDGLTATRRIRLEEREGGRARVPVLAYTSCPVHAAVLRDCGLDGVLDKPCTAEALHECLHLWCPARRGAGRGAADLAPLASRA